MSSQLDEHLALYDLLSPSQSAYRAGHSTDTALLALQNDLLLAASRGDGCVVLLIDLSAAFDTVDHARSLVVSLRFRWHCSVLVRFLFLWQAPICRHRWGTISYSWFYVWSSSGFGDWSKTVHNLCEPSSEGGCCPWRQDTPLLGWHNRVPRVKVPAQTPWPDGRS